MVRWTPVRWREGMFLRPQHLQQHELFLEAREQARVSLIEPEGWGVARLEIDETQLDGYVLKINALEAVLGDGTWVDIPRNARIAQRSFESALGRAGKPLDVFLGVPEREAQRAHVAPSAVDDSGARFAGFEAEETDLETGQSPAMVEGLQLNARLFFGEEQSAGYETLPLARLKLTGDPARPVSLDEAFAPPTLALAASRALVEPLRAATERIALSLRELGAETVDETRPRNLVLYQGLSSALPVLRDLLEEAKGHPRAAYRELTRLAGALCYPGCGHSADEIPVYSHREPAPAFEALRKMIISLSTPAIERRWARVDLTREGDLFSGALPESARTRGARIYLEVHAAESMQKVKTLVLGAKISSPDRIETLKTYLLPGVGTEPQPGPPPELPPGPVGSYFRLRLEDGDEWDQHVAPSGQIAVLLIDCPADVRAALVVILPAD